MKVLTAEEAKTWCSNAGLVIDDDELLTYSSSRKHKLFISAPGEFRKIFGLAYRLTTFRRGTIFYGGMLWLGRWDIGHMPDVGWRMIEGNRRGFGDLRSLESAPAQFFREDELLDLQAHLVQVIGFGWIADFVPADGEFFVHFKVNGQIGVIARDEKVLDELRRYLEDWNPTDEDPMVQRLRKMEAERQSLNPRED